MLCGIFDWISLGFIGSVAFAVQELIMVSEVCILGVVGSTTSYLATYLVRHQTAV